MMSTFDPKKNAARCGDPTNFCKTYTEKLTRLDIKQELKSGKWNGFGLITGEISGGVLAVDFDGQTALSKYRELSGGENPPKTLGWKSGKPGRFQLLFRVSHEQWADLKNRVAITTGDREQLEVRWNACQSVLPPSAHPDTDGYTWLNDTPDFDAIALVPDFVLDLLREQPIATPTLNFSASQQDDTLEAVLADSLRRLTFEQVFCWSGHNFKTQGKKLVDFCPRHGGQSGTAFQVDPQTNEWYCHNCQEGGGPVQYRHFLNGERGSPKGKDFIDIVYSLARDAGISIPEDRQKRSNPPNNNLVTHPKFQDRADFAQLLPKLDELIDLDLKQSELQAKLLALSQQFRVSKSDIWEIFRTRIEEREQEVDREDIAKEIERLLGAKTSKLNLAEILPATIVKPIVYRI